MKRRTKIVIAIAVVVTVVAALYFMGKRKKGNTGGNVLSAPSNLRTKRLSPFRASQSEIKGFIDRVDGELKPYVEGTEEATEALLEGKLKPGDAILGTDGRPVQII